MTVTVVSLCARGVGEQIEVCVEIGQGEHIQRERLCISASDCADLRLKKGTLSLEQYDRLAEASACYMARQKAMQCLTYGRCSKRRMVQKLYTKGIERSVAVRTADRLESEGYLNGEEDALREAERDMAKGWGERRIVSDLRAKGYSEEQVKGAVCALRKSGADGTACCAEQIRRRWGTLPEEPKERQRAIAALMRLGYSMAEIRRAAEMIK